MNGLTIEERVRRGMEFLDEKIPDWAQRINSEVLDLEDCELCVLGQVYGWFSEGLETGKAASEKGFLSSLFMEEEKGALDLHAEYEALQEEWEAQIMARMLGAP